LAFVNRTKFRDALPHRVVLWKLSRKWLQVGDHLVDLSTEYVFKLFLQDVLSHSAQRLVHLSQMSTSLLDLREALLRRNRCHSGTEWVTRDKNEWAGVAMRFQAVRREGSQG
jgi:hypothetical protein